MEPQSDYDRAVCRVEAKIGFFVHLAAYVLVNSLLIAINLAKTPQEIWFYWSLGGWGIGIAMHAWRVFSKPGISRLKQRMIQRELGKELQASDNRSMTDESETKAEGRN